jgi:hypothetical protein
MHPSTQSRSTADQAEQPPTEEGVLVDQRDLEGEAMIRQLPRNPEMAEDPPEPADRAR